MGKNIYIENLGCAKNQVDAEVMAHQLEAGGYTIVKESEDANLILINTCGFIESARQESIETFFELKKAHPTAKIALTGCMAQRYGEELLSSLSEADALFGNRDLGEIVAFVDGLFKGERKVLLPPFPPIEEEKWQRGDLFNYPGSAYLKLSEGCNHRCRYCAIPLIRGSLRSRPFDEIIEEAHELVKRGIKEINVIGQDLAAYGLDQGEALFIPLLKELVALEGEFKLRLLYIHPDFFPQDLINLIANEAKIIPYFDLPFQHAHRAVLEKMGRKGDKGTYLNLIREIRERLPEATIRSTFLLGFTGENRETIATLREFIEEAQIDWVGFFTYSREEETPSYNDSSTLKYRRVVKRSQKWQKELQALQQTITTRRLERLVGTEQDVLVEELVEGEDLAIGRTMHQAPEVDGLTVIMARNLTAGSVVRCGIRRVNGVDLEAVVVEE
ncbi:MAG: 30S ribosomal protein S12 methylthiotransferase RimO [Sphaerochaetaceae bacterium]